MTSLYLQMGGEPGLERAAEMFYRAVLADPLLAHFFDGIEKERQKLHQQRFLKCALAEEDPLRLGLGAAHRCLVEEMGLNQVHFNAILGHLESTLMALEMGREELEAVIERVEGMRDQVLGL